MSRIKYAQIHIGDFLSGCIQMDAAEMGSYFALIMAHYQAGEEGLEYGRERFARICHCTPRQWDRIKETVLEKFYIEGGFVKHERVISEIQKVKSVQKSRKSNEKVTKSSRKSNGILGQASEIKENINDITSNQKPIDKINTTCLQKPPPENEVEKKKPKKRATRIPEDWFVSVELGEWAMANGLERGEVVPTEEQFLDHYTAATGKGSTAMDWDAKFRTWVRNEIKWRK